jgi:1-phosphofructokinase
MTAMPPVLTVTLNPAIDQTVRLGSLALGQVNRADAVRLDPGGKGVNVAGCLADWGLAVTATGVLGRDNAPVFEAFFARKGIEDGFLRIDGATRTNIKLVQSAGADTTDINLPGAPVDAATARALPEAVAARAQAGGVVVLAGSVPQGLAPEIYARLTAMLAAKGARVVLDTSGAPLGHGLAAAAPPFCVKPNRAELEAWAGRALPSLEAVTGAARALHEGGIALVCVSLGAEGAVFVSGEGVCVARLAAPRVVSTVGAGDALVAGIVSALREELPLEGVARRGVAFAAAKLGEPGANLPPRAAVLALERAAILQTEILSLRGVV